MSAADLPIMTVSASSEAAPFVTIQRDGTIDIADGMTLDEAIAKLWAIQAEQTGQFDGSGFYAAMALLEVRRLAQLVDEIASSLAAAMSSQDTP